MHAFTLMEKQYKRENVLLKHLKEGLRLCGRIISDQLIERWKKKNDGLFEY